MRRPINLPGVAALLHGDLRNTRQRLAVLIERGGIADYKNFRMARHRQIVLNAHSARAIRANVQPFAGRRWGHARSPNDGLAEDALPRDDNAVRVNLIDPMSQTDLDTQFFEPCLSLRPERLSEKGPSTRGAMSSRMIRADSGWMRRNSDLSVLRTSTAIAPAISTPVGPAPTRTKVRRSRWRAGSSSASACSNACRILFRIATASARFFSPGANFANSLWPK